MNSEAPKLLFAIVSDQYKKEVLQALIQAGFQCIEIGTSSGWFSTGFSTFNVIAPAGRVADAIDIVENTCSPSPDPQKKRAVIYVLPLDEAGELQAEEV